MKEKILIVEDDVDISQDLQDFLEHFEFDTQVVDDGNQVISAVKRFEPNIVILDLMLPGKDGIECCKEIRKFSNVPVLMLTAKVEQIDKLTGLEVGADDYVCKPFDVMELTLRIKAIIKRTKEYIHFSTFYVNLEKREVRFCDQEVHLSALEFSLFELLHSSPERVFSREHIIELAYPHCKDITDRTIDSHIKNIRKKFKKLGLSLPVIETAYGIGYRFNTKN